MKIVRTGRYLSFFALNKELCGEDRTTFYDNNHFHTNPYFIKKSFTNCIFTRTNKNIIYILV